MEQQMSVSQQAWQIAQIACDSLIMLLKVIYFSFEWIYRLIVPTLEESVKGEIVLVTGAGHGIGRETAIQYAELGATVICWDINAETNNKTVAEIAKRGFPKAHAYSCDVSNRQAVFECVEKVHKNVGHITIIVNNAGIMPCHKLLEHTQTEIENIFKINVLAHFWIIQAILPSMIENNHGHIVGISSCAGMVGVGNIVPYCASKYAVVGIHDALYNELKQYPNCKIKLTVICPYMVDTGLCKKPVVRFKSLMEMASPEKVANEIISTQRRNSMIATFPNFYYYLFRLVKALPIRAGEVVQDFIGAGLDSDLH